MRLIRNSGAPRSAEIIDVGGGASTLVDDLLADGYPSLTVLDLSIAALSAAKARLGSRAANVRWIEADIQEASLPAHGYDVWHDRAVFHFLIAPRERQAYLEALLQAIKPEGHLIIATFAEDGPEQCSGLPVMRYSPEQLQAEFGSSFTLIEHAEEQHRTPLGGFQKFIYCHFRRN